MPPPNGARRNRKREGRERAKEKEKERKENRSREREREPLDEWTRNLEVRAEGKEEQTVGEKVIRLFSLSLSLSLYYSPPSLSANTLRR